jgi:hypothetical protein
MMKMTSNRSLPLLIASWVCCLASGQAQEVFTDVTGTLGIQSGPGGSSVAVGDYNNDGLEDLYVGFFNYPNQLWKNLGEGGFVEVANAARVALESDAKTRTALWGDIDNDGYLDLYVGNIDKPDKLLRNNGDGTFSDISQSAGVNQIGYPQSVNMADVNGDGLLDIYVSNLLQHNILYQNNGDLTFSNVTIQAGVMDLQIAMGTICFDYDQDGDVDLYLVHDNHAPNFLFQNDGTGHFIEVGAATGLNTASFGMGVDIGDINNDGWLDLSITNLGPNFLMLSNGQGSFADIAENVGVGDAGMGWGTSFLDFDRDGWVDLYVANDYNFSPYPNLLYRNNGDSTFTETQSGEAVGNLHASYGTASLDYDLDGDLDLVVANTNADAGLQLFENTITNDYHWIGLKLIGQESNRQAVGARVRLVDAQDVVHYDELTAGDGWTSQSSSLFFFGLGDAESLQEATIYWPSGLEQPLMGLTVDQYYSIEEGHLPVEGILPGPAVAVRDPAPEDLQIAVYPNPSPGQVLLELAADSDFMPERIRVYDELGRTLLEQALARPFIQPYSLELTRQQLQGTQYLIVQLLGQGRTVSRRVILSP